MRLIGRLGRLGGSSLIAGLLLTGCGEEKTVAAPAAERYVLALLGANERPNPVVAASSGSSVITVLNKDSIEFLIYVSNADSITASHIHAADINSAGPVMVFTFAGPTTGKVEGAWRFGYITRQSQYAGAFTFDSVLTRMRAGTSYLNVHTRKNGGGELRGQIVR